MSNNILKNGKIDIGKHRNIKSMVIAIREVHNSLEKCYPSSFASEL